MFQVRLRNIPPRARRDKKISDTHCIGWWANPKHDTDDNHSSNLFFFFSVKDLNTHLRDTEEKISTIYNDDSLKKVSSCSSWCLK